MQEDKDFISYLGNIMRAAVIMVFLTAAIVAFSQTAAVPPNYGVAASYAFEAAVKMAEPLKKYFPKPILITAE